MSQLNINKLDQFPPTLILRHRKENLKKCSLRGLEEQKGFDFYTYPLKTPLPNLHGYFLLTIDAPLLTKEDASLGLVLIDGTWRYAATMEKNVAGLPAIRRRLPAHFATAYPRAQTGCLEPKSGLASIEALYLAYHILGRQTEGLLDHYHWKNEFLQKNHL